MLDSVITDIEIIPFSIPLRSPVTFATGRLVAADHLLVRVRCRSGAEGVAEAIPRPMVYGETQVSVRHAIETVIRPAIVGMDALATHQIQSRLRHLVGNVTAKSSVELAIFDLIGRLTSTSCHRLLGGYAPDVRCTAIVGGEDPSQVADAIDRIRADTGIDSFKIKVGMDLRTDIERIVRAHEHVPDALLYVDANHGFSSAEALTFLRETQHMLAWIEEPSPAEEILGRSKVASTASVPVMGDESCTTTREVVNEILDGRATMIGIKLARTAIRESERIRDFTAAMGLPVLVASQGDSGIGTKISLAFAAAHPETARQPAELAYFRLLADDLLAAPPVIENGRMRVPDGPGFGLDIAPEKLARYRTDEKTH